MDIINTTNSIGYLINHISIYISGSFPSTMYLLGVALFILGIGLKIPDEVLVALMIPYMLLLCFISATFAPIAIVTILFLVIYIVFLK